MKTMLHFAILMLILASMMEFLVAQVSSYGAANKAKVETVPLIKSEQHPILKRSPSSPIWEKYLNKVHRYEAKSQERGSFLQQSKYAEKIANNQIKLDAWHSHTSGAAFQAGAMYLTKLLKVKHSIEKNQVRPASLIRKMRRWHGNCKFWRQMQAARKRRESGIESE